MIRRLVSFSSFATVILALVSAPARGQEPAPPPVFGELDIVRLDVAVLDDDGEPVRDLTADDFVVEEGGQPREVACFEPVVVRRRPAATEVHTQIHGLGRMQKFRERHEDTLYEDVLMPVGLTHDPFCRVAGPNS